MGCGCRVDKLKDYIREGDLAQNIFYANMELSQ
jgi:hypothetical protein